MQLGTPSVSGTKSQYAVYLGIPKIEMPTELEQTLSRMMFRNVGEVGEAMGPHPENLSDSEITALFEFFNAKGGPPSRNYENYKRYKSNLLDELVRLKTRKIT